MWQLKLFQKYRPVAAAVLVYDIHSSVDHCWPSSHLHWSCHLDWRIAFASWSVDRFLFRRQSVSTESVYSNLDLSWTVEYNEPLANMTSSKQVYLIQVYVYLFDRWKRSTERKCSIQRMRITIQRSTVIIVIFMFIIMLLLLTSRIIESHFERCMNSRWCYQCTFAIGLLKVLTTFRYVENKQTSTLFGIRFGNTAGCPLRFCSNNRK